MLNILITISQILTAGIVITAFSLVLYALPFNLKDKVARSYVFILICVSIIYTGEALGGTSASSWWVEFWLRFQWVGIIFLPATYIHFSESLLATTGIPTSPRRRWMVIAGYVISTVVTVLLAGRSFLGQLVTNQPPAPYLKPTLLADLFIVYYVVMVVYSWVMMYQAYRRTATPTSRRRMYYLMIGSVALAAGSFPFLLFGSGFAAQYEVLFWIIAIVTNLLVGTLMVVMAYAVAFFGVAWPDRVVKSRLFKWMMRGPATASITLGLVTLVRRAGETVGESYTAMVPLVMVASIILCEYAITLLAPYGSRVLFYGNDHKDLELIRLLEDRLITRGDLEQFIETILAAMCDRVQAGGAYLIAVSDGSAELVGRVGKLRYEKLTPDELNEAIAQQDEWGEVLEWKEDQIIPLFNGTDENEPELIGFLGISFPKKRYNDLDREELGALRLLYKRAE
ncbi:MAG: hypothetical protein HGA53_07850, partial [Anaerolineaceae bacterium]|nr:hypothetical protein [Anaerolineaceae bacterium]